jgi:outer membrane protein assembly factor BamB
MYTVQLNSFTADGNSKWTFNPIESFDPIENPYWLQLGKDSVYIHSSSCCAPDGSSKERIWEVSMNGTYISMHDTVGAATHGPDGTIYTLTTPDSAKGPVSYLHAMDKNGKTLWKYADGVSRMRYVVFGPKNALCMPSYTEKAGSVLCVDMKNGQQVYKQEVTDSPYETFDLVGSGWNLHIRKSRDNSYRHTGKNEMYPFLKRAGNDWTFTFPDDVDLVGSIAYAAGGALVVKTRPLCHCRPDSLIAVGPDGSMLWNATLPGEGDVSVNPAYPGTLLLGKVRLCGRCQSLA